MDSRGEADTRSPKTTSTTRASEAVRVFFAESRAGPLRGFNRGTEARYFAHLDAVFDGKLVSQRVHRVQVKHELFSGLEPISHTKFLLFFHFYEFIECLVRKLMQRLCYTLLLADCSAC